MSTKEYCRSLLLDVVSENISNYLKFRSSVYASTLPFAACDSGFDHRITYTNKDVGIVMKNGPETIEELKTAVEGCTSCDLHKTRTNVVFGSGTGKLRLMIIGEAPGADEDASGEPFVGRAGQLLTKMLSAIGLERSGAFICNVLKCRPPGNRDPKPDEIRKCSFYLDRQIEFLKPRYILALGRIAALRLLGAELTMSELRDKIHDYKGVPVIVTYHPSALLRNPKWKYPAWDDLKKLKDLLDKEDE